jgi:hypothetical protein
VNRHEKPFIALAVIWLCAGCADTQSQPAFVLPSEDAGQALRHCGQGGNGMLWAFSGGVQRLTCWGWDGLAVRRQTQIDVPEVWWLGAVGDWAYIATRGDERGVLPALVAQQLVDKKVLAEWPVDDGWYCNGITVSRSGKWVTAKVVEDAVCRPAGFDWNNFRLRVAVIETTTWKLTWAPMLEGERNAGADIRGVVPSDDGAYVCVAGWYNGAALLDVANHKVLWEKKPKGCIGMVDAAFAPDGKVVYVGDASGAVYVMDVATGDVLGEWWANDRGESVYGWRISTVAASADGRFVAAGTGPAGVVYVWRSDTGQRVRTLNHGGSTILVMTFSPDSKALASLAAGQIKVWTMPDLTASARSSR